MEQEQVSGRIVSEALRFGRAHRLRSARDFARVRHGRRASGALLTLAYLPNTTAAERQSATRVGFVVSKRVGSAVVRNRVRRRLREVLRRELPHLAPGWDLVVTARPPAAAAAYAQFQREVSLLLGRARLVRRAEDRGTEA